MIQTKSTGSYFGLKYSKYIILRQFTIASVSATRGTLCIRYFLQALRRNRLCSSTERRERS